MRKETKHREKTNENTCHTIKQKSNTSQELAPKRNNGANEKK